MTDQDEPPALNDAPLPEHPPGPFTSATREQDTPPPMPIVHSIEITLAADGKVGFQGKGIANLPTRLQMLRTVHDFLQVEYKKQTTPLIVPPNRKAWRGWAWRGWAGRGVAGVARVGKAGHGEDWRGTAGAGKPGP